MTQDYGETIHLPQTEFPRRAGLAKKEPELLKRWQEMNLYQEQRKRSEGREKFVLHMGPPFANGHTHMGHALSTVLKDVIVRSHQMLGYDAPLVPGFDCHGLPIEWKVEEAYRAKGMKKDDVDPVTFRKECRDFASHWLNIQSEEFQRMGINGDWANPYLTMRSESEALIAKEVHKFLLNGSLYLGSRPVMWSIPEQTTLAEAEIEYQDHTSEAVWVKFPLRNATGDFDNGSIVIWTTTPWTLPANRAISYGPNVAYQALTVTAVAEDSLAQIGDKLFICADLHDAFVKDTGITACDVVWSGTGTAFENMLAQHPLHDAGYDFDVPLLPGDHVTTEAGTGFVHTAPSHGDDDYQMGLKFNLPMPHCVAGDGTYTDEAPLFEGLAVYTAEGKKGPANKAVMHEIAERGCLVAKGHIRHSYPHSWRSKAPVIFRNTPQWFISMDNTGLRDTALTALKDVRFVPEKGRNRITSMVEGRGDWCISRQRSWGVPMAIFVDRKTGEPLKDEAVLNRTIDIFMKEGSDAWFDHPAETFLGDDYSVDDYEKINHIIDVWFESGSTHAFVLEQRPELTWPADLYLEGSDQHRGWFQSSLLVASGTRGTAPYKNILTHGFILDEKGYKMSKSGGNGLSPTELMDQFGADIVRLWVIGSDYTDDIKIGKNVLKGHTDIYRRIRNTFCYLLGNLADFDAEQHSVDVKDMPEFDRWALHRLHEMDEYVKSCIADYDFMKMLNALHLFCSKDLSAFYFDVNKDNLYCNAKDSLERRATQTVLDHIFKSLAHWFAPVLSFTCEEAWLSYKGLDFTDRSESIFYSTTPKVPTSWQDDALAAKWQSAYDVRRVVTGAIELKRASKEIRSSLEALPVVYIADAALRDVISSTVFEDVCITSSIEISADVAPEDAFTLDDVEGIAVVIGHAEGDKCERCWKYTDDCDSDTGICTRCGHSIETDGAS